MPFVRAFAAGWEKSQLFATVMPAMRAPDAFRAVSMRAAPSRSSVRASLTSMRPSA